MGGIFDEEAKREGLKLADQAGLLPVSAGDSVFEAISGVSARIDAVLEHNVPQPPEALHLADQIQAALRSKGFIDEVKALDRLLGVALMELHKAKRDDVAKLLDDPLSTETRNTRRNLGVLTVLAVLVGFAGKAPDSFLGLGMTTFPKWAFPLVLYVVVVYEFVGFTLYLNADLERRGIHSVAAQDDRDRLLKLLAAFEKRQDALTKFMSGDVAAELLRGNGKVEEAGSVVPRCATLAAHWRKDAAEFDREFGIQWRRRWWDEYMPFALVVVAHISLISLIPFLRLWVWELFH